MVMPINKEKLALRSKVHQSMPEFKRPESWRYKRLETSWRKPKGVDNHQRKQKSRGRPGIVKVGYGGPKITRGLHPSGYTDNLVFTNMFSCYLNIHPHLPTHTYPANQNPSNDVTMAISASTIVDRL